HRHELGGGLDGSVGRGGRLLGRRPVPTRRRTGGPDRRCGGLRRRPVHPRPGPTAHRRRGGPIVSRHADKPFNKPSYELKLCSSVRAVSSIAAQAASTWRASVWVWPTQKRRVKRPSNSVWVRKRRPLSLR